MKFSAQEEYGLRCLIEIARSGDSLTIPQIAEREHLSEPHVAKLLTILRKAGFIRSTRGHTGGYRLSSPPEQIAVGRVLEALGGRLYEEGFCERHSGLTPTCAHGSSCAVQFLWDDIQRAVDLVVNRVTLADLLARTPAPAKLVRVRAKFNRQDRERISV